MDLCFSSPAEYIFHLHYHNFHQFNPFFCTLGNQNNIAKNSLSKICPNLVEEFVCCILTWSGQIFFCCLLRFSLLFTLCIDQKEFMVQSGWTTLLHWNQISTLVRLTCFAGTIDKVRHFWVSILDIFPSYCYDSVPFKAIHSPGSLSHFVTVQSQLCTLLRFYVTQSSA